MGKASPSMSTTLNRGLARTCKFRNLHDSLLKDRIYPGINYPKIRKKLLQEQGLTLDRCVDLCVEAKATKLHIKVMGAERNISTVKRSNEKRRKPFTLQVR